MKKTSVFFYFLIISAILSSCNGQDRQPLVLPSNTPAPSTTVSPTQTMVRPTSTPKPTLTPTITLIPPYLTKPILLNYTVGGFHTPFNLYYVNIGVGSNLVLYTDGQLIIPGKTFQQKILSKDEISQLFSKLKSMGFFALTQDNLYNFGNQEPPKVYDGATYCVSAFGEMEQNLCAYEPLESFLVPEMKNILRFLNEYQLKGMTPYYPDRILLWVQAGRSPDVNDLPKESIPWQDNFPSLATFDQKIIYAEEDTARKIFALFGNEISFKVFVQDGIEYTVVVDIVLPHEEITNLWAQ